MTKAELEAEIVRLQQLLDLASQDYQSALDHLEKLEHRHILIKVRHDGVVLDAVVVPPEGKSSHWVRTDFLDEQDDVEIWTEPIE